MFSSRSPSIEQGELAYRILNPPMILNCAPHWGRRAVVGGARCRNVRRPASEPQLPCVRRSRATQGSSRLNERPIVRSRTLVDATVRRLANRGAYAAAQSGASRIVRTRWRTNRPGCNGERGFTSPKDSA
jgi:hypothetical protein